MKKIISIFLVFSILFAFAACSKNKGPMDESASINSTGSESTKNNVENTTKKEEESMSARSASQISNLKDCKTICANGTVVTLPIEFSEFFAIMKDFKPCYSISEENRILEPGQYTGIIVVPQNDIFGLFDVYILNDSTESKKFSECVVAGVSVRLPLLEDNKAPDIQLLGLRVGQKTSVDEFINKFGEPNETYSYNRENDSLSGMGTIGTYIWEIESTSGDSNSNKVEVDINNNNGTIEALTVMAFNDKIFEYKVR